MRKCVGLILLMVYLFGTTELHQLMKLPRLVEHYEDFLQKSPESNFYAFFRIHYLISQDPETDSDYDQDMQLPFKSSDNHFMLSFANLLVPKPIEVSAPRKLTISEKKFYGQYDNSYCFSIGKSIFQPPKSIV
ncbi:hypothetical protein [Rhizosphaericola mali]|uniref:Uncharacterized protein n=1 Tax=Rhizosphaericola mali TaxID=2545455 RepID=A0A5P2G226_9BACT|nr:hypothetical protein [Rhizosphaericola mali]QES87882.1 hypothetical protein E0W69_004125 [Rhizosphaericola mali]